MPIGSNLRDCFEPASSVYRGGEAHPHLPSAEAQDAKARCNADMDFISQLVTEGKLEVHQLISPPGAGSGIIARWLMAKGSFDGLLLEPAAQFDPERNSFPDIIGTWARAIRRFSAQRDRSERPSSMPLRILLVEKPYLLAPGDEMTFTARMTKQSLFVIRNPYDCLHKRLRIQARFFADELSRFQSLDSFVSAGYISPNQALTKHLADHAASPHPLSHRIRDYLIFTSDYSVITPRFLDIANGRFENSGMIEAISRSTYNYNYGRTLSEDDELSRRFLGLGIDEYFETMRDIFSESNSEWRVLDYEDFIARPTEKTRYVLERWGIEDRPCNIKVGEYVHSHYDPGFLDFAFSSLFSESDEITPRQRTIGSENLPLFLRSILEREHSEYLRLGLFTPNTPMHMARSALLSGVSSRKKRDTERTGCDFPFAIG